MKAHTASFTSTPQLVSYNASKDDKIYLLLWEPEQQESICVAWKTRRDPMPTVVDLPSAPAANAHQTRCCCMMGVMSVE